MQWLNDLPFADNRVLQIGFLAVCGIAALILLAAQPTSPPCRMASRRLQQVRVPDLATDHGERTLSLGKACLSQSFGDVICIDLFGELMELERVAQPRRSLRGEAWCPA